MKQIKLDSIRRVLKSAEQTKHINHLHFDNEDSSFTFRMKGVLYEIQWDDSDLVFEMVRYNSLKSFERLGEVDGDKLTDIIYNVEA